MDTSPWLNGPNGLYQPVQTSQQYQGTSTRELLNCGFWSVPSNPGYGTIYTGGTSNHLASTSSQQLSNDRRYTQPQNNFTQGNGDIQTSYVNAQTSFTYNGNANDTRQIAIRQDPHQVVYENQSQPNMTANTATFLLQNPQYQVSNMTKQPSSRNGAQYLQKILQATLPQNALVRPSQLPWYNKNVQDCKNNGSWIDGTQPPSYMSARKLLSKEHEANLNVPTVQLTGFQRDLQTDGAKENPPSANIHWHTHGPDTLSTNYCSKSNNRTHASAAGNGSFGPMNVFPLNKYAVNTLNVSQFVYKDGTAESGQHGQQMISSSNIQYNPNPNSSLSQEGQIVQKPQKGFMANTADKNVDGTAKKKGEFEETINMQNYHQLSVAGNAEQSQAALLSVNATDGSSHKTPVYDSQKAIAVVQPLLQESYRFATKGSSPEIIGQCKDTPTDYVEKPINSSQLVSHLTNGDFPINDNVICTGIPSDLRKQLNGDLEPTRGAIVTYSDLTVDNSNANAKQAIMATQQQEADQSTTIHLSAGETRQIKEREGQDKPDSDCIELSTIPVIPWTYGKLTALIEMSTKCLLRSEPLHQDNELVRQLLSNFWENSLKKFLCLVNTDYYKDLMTETIDFCLDYNAQDSLILSQVSTTWAKLKTKCNILDHDYAHFDLPYVSSWLNVNAQLDDIDKEFGFPWCLKYCLRTGVVQEEPTMQEEPTTQSTSPSDGEVPVDIVNEIPSENVPQTDPALDRKDPVKEFDLSLLTNFPPSSFADDTSKADSLDPCSWEIQILPQDEARILFEQLKSETPKMMFANSSELTSKKDVESPIDEYCCVDRWMGVILGKDDLSLKCYCKQSLESDYVIWTDVLLDSSEKVHHHISEDIINEATSNPTASNDSKMSKSICFTETLPHSTNDILLPITETSHSTSMDVSEKVVTVFPGISGGAIEDCRGVELKPTGPAETLLNMEQKQPHKYRHYKYFSSKLTSTGQINIVVRSLEHSSGHKNKLSRSHKRKRTLERRNILPKSESLPPPKKARTGTSPLELDSRPTLGDTSNNINMGKIDAGDMTSNTIDVRTVKLALFGTLAHRNGVLTSCGNMSSKSFPGKAQRPPAILTVVNVISDQKSVKETVSLLRSPLKRRLGEEWKKSYLPIKRRRKKSQRTASQNSPLAEVAPVKAKHMDTRKPPVSPEPKFAERTVNDFSKKKLISNGTKLIVERSTMAVKSESKLRMDNMKSKHRIHKDADIPVKENSVLRFGVLPKTFNFKDGSLSPDETRDSLFDASDCAVAKGGLKKIIKKSRGCWALKPEKKESSLTSSRKHSPKTMTAFQEFQNKYKRRQSVD